MKSLLNRFLLLVVLVSTIVGCQKDEIKRPDTETDRVEEVRNIFAETLSRALVDDRLRGYIHEKMQLAYYTGYEMVYIAEKAKVVYDGKTLAEILTAYADPEVLKANGDDFFMKLTDITPLLTIGMPELLKMNATLWDVNIVPKVAAVLDAGGNSYVIYGSGDTQVGFRDEEYDYYEDDDGYFSDPTLSVWDAEGYYLVKGDGMTAWGKHVEDYMPGKEGEKSGCQILLGAALSALEAYEVSGDYYYLVQHDTLIALYK